MGGLKQISIFFFVAGHGPRRIAGTVPGRSRTFAGRSRERSRNLGADRFGGLPGRSRTLKRGRSWDGPRTDFGAVLGRSRDGPGSLEDLQGTFRDAFGAPPGFRDGSGTVQEQSFRWSSSNRSRSKQRLPVTSLRARPETLPKILPPRRR